jgi:hypothetical protein
VRLTTPVKLDQTDIHDPKEPGAKTHTPVFKARQYLDHAQEDIGGDVFGDLPILHTVVDITENGRDMRLIELSDGVRVAALGAKY